MGTRPARIFGGFSFSTIIIPWILFTLALARPQTSETFRQYSKSGVDIVLAIDVSLSMHKIYDFVVDGKRTDRLYAARELAKDFILKRPNDRIGVVAFAGRPYEVSPITMNHDWLPRLIDSEVVYSDDTAPGTAIGSAISYSSVKLDSKAKGSESKIIILITDGSWNSGKIAPETAAELSKDLGIKIYSLAIGTEWGRLQNHHFHVPKQEFDTVTLENVAKITEGQYYRAKTTESLRDAFSAIDKLEKVDAPVTEYKEVTEYHQWFTATGLLSLLVILIASLLKPSE